MPAVRADGPSFDRRAGFAFVGREGELRSLMVALREGPAVVFVEGASGIGKSRLLQEAEHRIRAAGTPVLRGACHPLREPLPFGPVVDALRDGWSHFGPEARFGPSTAVLAAYLPELADRLPATGPDMGLDPEGSRGQRLMRAVHQVLGALGPAVLMVEDVHWADDATRDLLLLLARNPPGRLRLVLTYRARDLPGSGSVLGSPYRRPIGVGGTEMILRPLSQAQVRELAASAIGPAATGSLCRALYERSGGIPIAAEEDLLVLAGHVTRGGGALQILEDALVPRALQEAVNSRIEPLGADATTVVQAAAVLAVPAGEELLAAVAAMDEDQAGQALIAALEADVLVEKGSGRYGFHHVLARRAVYDQIPGPRRRRLHARAAEALEWQDPPALVQVAHHIGRLGDTAAWLPRALAAADHAFALGDDGVAAELLGQLLAEPTLPPDDRTRAALALGTIAAFRTDPAASVATLRRIVADPALPTGIRGEMRFNLIRILTNTDAYWEDLAELRQAIAELETRPATAASAMATLSFCSAMSERGDTVAEDLALMDRAERLAAGTGDTLTLADVLATRIGLLEIIGDPRGRELLKELPLRATDRDILRHCARALHNAAYYEMSRGCDQTAHELLGEAEELGRHTDSEILELGCRAIRLGLDVVSGHWAGLDRRIEATLSESAEDSTIRLALTAAAAILDTAGGRWLQARTRLTPLTTAANADIGPMAISMLARLDMLEDDAPAAWQRIQPVVVARRRKGLWAQTLDLVPTAVQAALACGRRDEAHRITDDAEHGIQGLNAPGVAAGASWCRGLLAADTDPEGALTHLERARIQYDAIGRAPTVARVVEQSGLLALAHNPGRATRDLHHALDTFTRLGATADAARCQRALRDNGLPRLTPRSRRSYGTDLSPREQEVAQLLAGGSTNQQIARSLALSPRTVEHHVASVLKKLSVTRDRVQETLDTDS
ncbi:helix-turn-helix transcriptional regulator [Kitasatospora herbaricolor]|uniref:ATP-binding protein n=1 Tax=Kitasatospora herbaricolor TaxID=68217 RepID=UPI00174D7668|nr:LuxR family transcriptional regulator [Kitasatospora herbaricolor]MDQ0305608.1 DNA-binding CsgD family transcriptional regulator [Kitasatospora herbaricolor]GGV47125.1 helix-turn-helix transcriptional regulator [Kitasatospora herbaricolor]